MNPGDILLFAGRSWYSRLIELGQRRQYGDDPAARWSHAAVAVSPTEIVEAVGSGVRLRHFDPATERTPFILLPIVASDADRAQIADFARDQVGDPYGPLTILSIALTLATGCRVNVSLDGTWICSELAAEALTRADFRWPTKTGHVKPADLYRALKETPHAP